jgi:hypothetical protein
MIRIPVTLLLLQFMAPSMAQQVGEAPLMAPVMNDAVQGGWLAQELEKQAALWEGLVGAPVEQGPFMAHLNHFRSERNAALARNGGAIPEAEQARLQSLAKDLEQAAPNSFEAHMANYYVAFPAPAAFMHLDLAKAKGPNRTELLAPLMANAARKFNFTELASRAITFRNEGGVPPALWHLADDVLLALDRNAVLFVAGDMDTYPLWVVQYGNGRRQDVLVVDQRLLHDPAYRQRVWAETKAKGKVPGDPQEFLQALPLATDRPVHYALSLGRETLAPLKDRLYLTGMSMRFSRNPFDNIAELERSWAQMRKDTGAGPLARNYLVPGAYLLLHYKRTGDERNASMMEHELRRLARALGASADLYRAGVLEH